MTNREKERMIALQAMLKIATTALQSIRYGDYTAYSKAEEALEKIEEIKIAKAFFPGEASP